MIKASVQGSPSGSGVLCARIPGRFWACYTLGLLLRLPQAAAAAAADQFQYARDYARTFRRRVVLLGDALELWFLGGYPADMVPLVFGERFAAWYRGVLVDPGSVRMRPSLAAHLQAAAGRGQPVATVTATHAHEEHVGNLEWAARRVGAPVLLAPQIAARLRPAAPSARAALQPVRPGHRRRRRNRHHRRAPSGAASTRAQPRARGAVGSPGTSTAHR